MINRILAIAVLVLIGLVATPASAATAISYSEPDNAYGWCTGYSTSEAPGCARNQCQSSGGIDCELALVCDAGWNAVVFADSDEAAGFGAACDMNSAYQARIVALVGCMVRSRTVCWTSGVFNGNGVEQSSNSNSDFDLTWYTQALLLGLGYDTGDPDGVYGNRTRRAIEAFQNTAGLPATGTVTEDLFYLLLSHAGGTPFLVSMMDSLINEFSSDEVARSFSAAAAPKPAMTLTEELATRNATVQRAMIASYLFINDHDCPVPATSVAVDTAASTWTVSCRNGGEFTLVLSDDGSTGTIYDNRQAAVSEPEPEPEPEPQVVEEPVQQPTTTTTTTTTAPSSGGKDKSSGPTRGKDKG
jgi:peptidoglycan hydrolase-like protein with peptidoglycan-binding domain